MKRLEEAGIITRYAAVLDGRKLGLRAFAYVHVSLTDHAEATVRTFSDFVAEDDQVIECASITGDADFVLKVAARDPEGLEAFIMKRILRLGVVRNANTNFILRQTKVGGALPIPDSDDG
ncbi:Lrp/AsnC family transcriptional regulator [Jannaschia sp. M317]|uniref:Lrp/AsnC family transcriptional regulator n=1 Tax=Jannaschia sp. M317 TaxID=2867011 RepID=UPI0021A35F84|nr:Lrp/AsnC family transcriptional regulator [Jannaschia sp. M317]